jgi:hypothetical protein
MDITLFTSQGITPFRAEWVEYETNPRNDFKYRIKFLKHEFDDELLKMTAKFRVERKSLSNGEWIKESWTHEAICVNTTLVDKDGNVITEQIIEVEGVPTMNPLIWGGEYDRMAVLFNAPLIDSEIVYGYQQELFDKGIFDFPKNRNI